MLVTTLRDSVCTQRAPCLHHRAERAVTRSFPGDMSLLTGTGWPRCSFVVQTATWRPATKIVKTDLQGLLQVATEIIVVENADLAARWPLVPDGYHVSFRVEAMVSGRLVTAPITIHDQGAALQQRPGELGRGVHVSRVAFGCTGSLPAIPSGTKILSFAIVCKAPYCNDAQLAALYATLRSLNVGSGQYFCLGCSRDSMLVYDVLRSTGHLANSPLLDHVKPGVSMPSSNLRMVYPSGLDVFTASWQTTKPLRIGTHLFGPYGNGCSLNKEIRNAQEKRRERVASRSPVANAKRAARVSHMEMMRAAKAARRDLGA